MRIIYSQQVRNQHQQQTGWSDKINLYQTDDFLETEGKLIMEGGNKFILGKKYIYIAYAPLNKPDKVQLMVSQSTVNKYVFQKVEFPKEDQEQNSFTFLDISHNGAIVNLAQEYDALWGSIFTSDHSGIKFIDSVHYNVKNSEGSQCDFVSVKKISGIYFINQYEEEKVKKYLTFKYTKFGKVDQKKINQQAIEEKKLRQFITSKVTFDNGRTWNFIEGPMYDTLNNKIFNRRLHLHSFSAHYQPLYSSSSAMGLLVGIGNVGDYLDYNKSKVNTYLSRDAGLTWQEIRKGSYLFGIADHGGIIVITKEDEAVNYVEFSTTEGHTWQKYGFGEEMIEVTNILTEPTQTGLKFIIYGEVMHGLNKRGVAISIDFTKIFDNKCQESDYENWIPHTNLINNCILGSKKTYQHRKQDSQCYNGVEHEHASKVEYCTCGEEDYECDVGYTRDDNNICIQLFVKEGEQTEPIDCQQFWYITRGYRKIEGNECRGGLDLNPDQMQCSSKFSLKWAIFILIVLGTAYYIRNNQQDIVQPANINQYKPIDDPEDEVETLIQ